MTRIFNKPKEHLPAKHYEILYSRDEYTFPTEAHVQRVDFNDTHMILFLEDERIIHVPLKWIPTLYHNSPKDRAKVYISSNGRTLHWDPDESPINEDIYVATWMRYDEINCDDDELTDEERKRQDWEIENSLEVMEAEVVGPHSLYVLFEDGTDRTIDFENALKTIYTDPIFVPLLNPEYFAQVALDDGQLVWPNGAKFKWAHIYKWDEHLVAVAGKE